MLNDYKYSTAISRKDKGNLYYQKVLEDDLKAGGVYVAAVPRFPHHIGHGFVFITNKPFLDIVNIEKYFSCTLDELDIVQSINV